MFLTRFVCQQNYLLSSGWIFIKFLKRIGLGTKQSIRIGDDQDPNSNPRICVFPLSKTAKVPCVDASPFLFYICYSHLRRFRARVCGRTVDEIAAVRRVRSSRRRLQSVRLSDGRATTAGDHVGRRRPAARLACTRRRRADVEKLTTASEATPTSWSSGRDHCQ